MKKIAALLLTLSLVLSILVPEPAEAKNGTEEVYNACQRA